MRGLSKTEDLGLLANQELILVNSNGEQLKCCSISARMVAFRCPSFSGVLKEFSRVALQGRAV